jgi:hypothetical protein
MNARQQAALSGVNVLCRTCDSASVYEPSDSISISKLLEHTNRFKPSDKKVPWKSELIQLVFFRWSVRSFLPYKLQICT